MDTNQLNDTFRKLLETAGKAQDECEFCIENYPDELPEAQESQSVANSQLIKFLLAHRSTIKISFGDAPIDARYKVGDIVEMKFTASSAGYSDTSYWREAKVLEIDGWKYILSYECGRYLRGIGDIREAKFNLGNINDMRQIITGENFSHDGE